MKRNHRQTSAAKGNIIFSSCQLQHSPLRSEGNLKMKKKKTLSLVFPYSLRGTFSIFWVFIFARKVAAMAGVGKPIPARKEAGGQRSTRYVYLFFSFFFVFRGRSYSLHIPVHSRICGARRSGMGGRKIFNLI